MTPSINSRRGKKLTYNYTNEDEIIQQTVRYSIELWNLLHVQPLKLLSASYTIFQNKSEKPPKTRDYTKWKLYTLHNRIHTAATDINVIKFQRSRTSKQMILMAISRESTNSVCLVPLPEKFLLGYHIHEKYPSYISPCIRRYYKKNDEAPTERDTS